MSKLLVTGGFNNNMNTAWKAAKLSNAKEDTRTGWGIGTSINRRDCTSWQGMGQRGSKFQSRCSYRGRNGT
jgi:hypothetical protein